MTKRIALYPASFDPITIAHVSIVQRAARIFDEVYVAVAVNPNKREALLTPQQRLDLISECFSSMPTVKPILLSSGLTIDHARRLKVGTLIRGSRNTTNYNDEVTLFEQNLHIQASTGALATGSDFIDTITFHALPEERHISSSLVRTLIRTPDVAEREARIQPLVPNIVFEAIMKSL